MTTVVCSHPSVALYLARLLRRAELLGLVWGVIFLPGSVYVRVRGRAPIVQEVIETAHVHGVKWVS